MSPNGPALVRKNAGREQVHVHYADLSLIKLKLKVLRSGETIGLGEAGARIITVSRSKGWDAVTQIIKVSAIGLIKNDQLDVRGTLSGRVVNEETALVENGPCRMLTRDDTLDFQLGVEVSGSFTSVSHLDEQVKVIISCTHLLFRFRPCVSVNHTESDSIWMAEC